MQVIYRGIIKAGKMITYINKNGRIIVKIQILNRKESSKNCDTYRQVMKSYGKMANG